jgi:hypothetical protein
VERVVLELIAASKPHLIALDLAEHIRVMIRLAALTPAKEDRARVARKRIARLRPRWIAPGHITVITLFARILIVPDMDVLLALVIALVSVAPARVAALFIIVVLETMPVLHTTQDAVPNLRRTLASEVWEPLVACRNNIAVLLVNAVEKELRVVIP